MGQLCSKTTATTDETEPSQGDLMLDIIKAVYRNNWREKVLDGPEFEVVCKIGQGAFGKVFKCRKRSGDVVAIKELSGNHFDKNGMGSLARELAAMKQCSQRIKPFFVQPHDWLMTDTASYIIMEYYPHGSLEDWMKKRGNGFCRKKAFVHSMWLILGIEFLHDLNIIHRDLKPSNILVEILPDGNEQLRIADFGFAKMLDEQSGQTVDEAAYHSGVGTPSYMAPEVRCGHSYSKSADIYALGKIIAYLHIGPEMDEKEIQTDNCGYPVFAKYPEKDCHSTAVGRMMCAKKDQRLTLGPLVKYVTDSRNCNFNFGESQCCPAPCNKKLTSADGTLELF